MTENLLKFRSLTGSDSTSYFYRVGKIKVWKKLLKNAEKVHLIDSIGINKGSINYCATEIVWIYQLAMWKTAKNSYELLCIMVKEQGGYPETRVRLSKNQSTKTSISLPPDPDSCKQAIKRAHCQTYYWNNCLQLIIDPINVEENGWEIKDKIYPVWFTGPQLPPSCSNKKKTQNIVKVTN